MGFTLVGLALLNLILLIIVYKRIFLDFTTGVKGRGYDEMF